MDKRTTHSLEDLLYLMARLRNPNNGCPWDCQQNFESITSHTLEEAYEVVDAIERKDYPHLCEELGDLLFQVVFYAQIAEEEGYFNFFDIVDRSVKKLVSRHPHVFPDGTLSSHRATMEISDAGEVSKRWESIKQAERKQRGNDGVWSGIPNSLTALMRANKLQKRAANYQFDWPNHTAVVEKVQEELSEVLEEVEKGNATGIEEELGDLLFACVNLARHLDIDSERALRLANTKFERRFIAMLDLYAREEKDKSFSDLTPELQNQLWARVKEIENH